MFDTNMKFKKLKQKLCGMYTHKWTSAFEEGVPIDKELIDKGIEGFNEYSKMYCKRCGYVYKP